MAIGMLDINRIPHATAAIQVGMNRYLDRVGKQTVERIEQGFDGGHDALGREWQSLSPHTIERKGHDQVLFETGELKESFDYDIERGELRIGSSDPNLERHEFGRGVPRRPVLQPAVTWANQQLIVGEARDTFGASLDAVTF